MSDYPAGVITIPAELSVAAFDAKSLGGEWTVWANRRLKWSATGQPVLARPIVVRAGENPTITIDLPATDQTGFVDAVTGVVISGFTYTATYRPIAAPLMTSAPFTMTGSSAISVILGGVPLGAGPFGGASLGGGTLKVAPLLDVAYWPYAATIDPGTGGGPSTATYVESPPGSGLFRWVA